MKWKSLLSVWLSRKLWATLISFSLIYFVHEKAVEHLYTLVEPHQCAALTTIYVSTLSVLGVIVAAYLGTNALQARFGLSGAAQVISEAIKEERTERIERPKYYDSEEIE